MFFSFLLNSLIFSISLRMFKLFCMFFSFLLNSLIFSFNSVSALPLSLRTSLRSPLRLSISDLTSAADLSAHFAINSFSFGAQPEPVFQSHGFLKVFSTHSFIPAYSRAPCNPHRRSLRHLTQRTWTPACPNPA